jgi:hypothetical protein
VCFRARVLDAAGCAIENAPINWSLKHGPGIRARLQAGCFEAGDSSAESEGAFKVIAAHGTHRVEAPVVVSVVSLTALLAKRLEAGALTGEEQPGPSPGTEPSVAAPSSPSTRVAARAVSEPESSSRRWLTALAALLAALAGVLLLIRRSTPRRRASTQRKQPRTRRCPRCGIVYPEGDAFCGEDGSELLPPQ